MNNVAGGVSQVHALVLYPYYIPPRREWLEARVREYEGERRRATLRFHHWMRPRGYGAINQCFVLVAVAPQARALFNGKTSRRLGRTCG
eukprot:scaffold7127_cov156-Isochrysis_galbana.AAC.1